MEMYFKKFGEGQPLIIMHGLYGSSDNWHTLGKALSKYFTVYLPDLRNHGKSPHTKEHNYTLLKNDLFEFMLKHKIDKAVILGHSMGGKAAMFFAADYPEKVQSLIIIDISPRSYKSMEEPTPQSIDHMNVLTAMLSVDFSRIKSREDVDKLLSDTIRSFRIRRFLLKNVHRNHDGSFRWKLNVQTLHDNFPAIMDGLSPERFLQGNRITGFPVLFIKGEKSNYITAHDIRLIKTIFPMAEIVSIPGGSHWLHAEQPDLLMKTIKYFIFGK